MIFASFLLQSLFSDNDNSVSSQLLDELFLALAAGEGSDVASPSLGILNSHMAETTNTEDGDFLTRLSISGNWSISGDTSAEKWGNLLFRESFRNLEEELSRVLKGGSITSPVERTISELLVNDFVRTELVVGVLAGFTDTAAFSLATETDFVTNLVFRDF